MLVGKDDDRKEFIVYKSFIGTRSPFFKAACGEPWDRGKPIDMSNHSIEAFQIYLQCLYQNVVIGLDDQAPTFKENIAVSTSSRLRLAPMLSDESD